MFAAHIPRSVVSAVIPIAVLLLLVTAMPRMPARAQDACLPGDAGACLPLPPCLTLPQPARPPDMWSRPHIWRATLYGSLKEVEIVPIRPMFLVRAASAASTVIGS